MSKTLFSRLAIMPVGYEIFEWCAVLGDPNTRLAVLGSQGGYLQKDMLCDMLGAVAGLVVYRIGKVEQTDPADLTSRCG